MMDRNYEILAHWITERESIRKKKESGESAPWSNDSILNTNRFCNVRREDDKVTRWIARHWRNPNAQHQYLIPNMAVARFINWPETLSHIGYSRRWDPVWVKQILRGRFNQGLKVWGGAYIISTNGKSMPKEDYVVDVVLTPLFQYFELLGSPRLPWRSLEELYGVLRDFEGIGSFMAGQIIADVKNVPRGPLEAARDWRTWCCSGPGSRKGLNYLLGYKPESPWREEVFQKEVLRAWDVLHPNLPADLQDLHMQDFQNCLCEYSKYRRIMEGGRAKSRYRPGQINSIP